MHPDEASKRLGKTQKLRNIVGPNDPASAKALQYWNSAAPSGSIPYGGRYTFISGILVIFLFLMALQPNVHCSLSNMISTQSLTPLVKGFVSLRLLIVNRNRIVIYVKFVCNESFHHTL